jgi:hypothetical protein
MVLSVIRLPIQWCHPLVRRSDKDRRFTRRTRRLSRTCPLLALLALSNVPIYHALPGTDHVLIKGKTSSDISRQQQSVRMAINNAAISHPLPPDMAHSTTANDNAKPVTLRNTPYCFVADTGSIPYVLDTGAN